MAEETVFNGGDVVDRAAEDFFDLDETDGDHGGANVAELKRRIEELDDEKKKLTRENDEMKDRIEKLTGEMEELRGGEAEMKRQVAETETEVEMEEREEEKKVLESVTARAAELETEVSRLQHDLITAVNAGEETAAEVAELKRVLTEKRVKLGEVEKEVEALRKVRVDSEKKVRELERKIGVLEVRESEDKSKKVRVEEEMRERIGHKEEEISELRKKIEILEAEEARNGEEMYKWRLDKKGMEEALEESEKKAVKMEMKMVELQKKVEEAETAISGFKGKIVEQINGVVVEDRDDYLGPKSRWPVVVAGSAGVAGLAAVVFFVCYSRRRNN